MAPCLPLLDPLEPLGSGVYERESMFPYVLNGHIGPGLNKRLY